MNHCGGRGNPIRHPSVDSEFDMNRTLHDRSSSIQILSSPGKNGSLTGEGLFLLLEHKTPCHVSSIHTTEGVAAQDLSLLNQHFHYTLHPSFTYNRTHNKGEPVGRTAEFTSAKPDTAFKSSGKKSCKYELLTTVRKYLALRHPS